MVRKKISEKDLAEFRAKCERLRQNQTVRLNETPQAQAARKAKALQDYSFFFATYLRHYCSDEHTGELIACAPAHLELAKKMAKNNFLKVAFEAHRGFAKSVHSNVGIPLWLKIRGDLKFMVLIGENRVKARILLSDIQAELEANNLFIHDFGTQLARGSWTDGEFATRDGCAFVALGLGQDPAGLRNRAYRPDYIVGDDLDTLKMCANPRRVRLATDWITDVVMGCFGKARERFVLANNRIHQKSILTTFIKKMKVDDNFVHLQVNCLDAKGNPTWPARYTKEYWATKRANTPARTFARNYENNPQIDGALFKNEWIRYVKPLPLREYDDLVGYWDLSYSKGGDYKAFVLVGRKGRQLHVLKTFCRQAEGSQAAAWLYDLQASLKDGPSPKYYFEGIAAQQIVFGDLFTEEGDRRGWYVDILPDTRVKGNKHQRVEATLVPQFFGGYLHFSEKLRDDADTLTLTDQVLAFEQGSTAPDDGPDALEGAVHRLVRSAQADPGNRSPNLVKIGKTKNESVW